MHPSGEVGRFQMDNLSSRPGDCGRSTNRSSTHKTHHRLLMSHQDDHALELRYKATQAGDVANEKWFGWVRQMLSLSFAGLTALVALQRNYSPDSGPSLYLLWGTFVFLAASVIAAAIVLRGEGIAQRELSRDLDRDADKPIENRKSLHGGRPPQICESAGKYLPWFLALSVFCLTSFAITNSLPAPNNNEAKTENTQTEGTEP